MPPLNSDWVSEMCRQNQGLINNPDIAQILRAIVRASERWGREALVVWKTDLKGAFNLLHFRPEDVHLMCTQVTAEVIFCYLRGNFGWTGMPFNFEVLTRVLRVIGNASINGEGFMYVDDFVAVGRRASRTLPVGHTKDNGSWQQDRERVIRLMVGLLGDNAEAEDKREDSDHPPRGEHGEYWDAPDPSQRRISVLGWEINLSTWTVGVAEKNRIRAIHAFGSFDPKRHHPRKTYETLCSYAERYSKIYRGLAPLMHHLYEMLNGWGSSSSYQKSPSAEFCLVSKLWLAYLLLSEAQAATSAFQGRDLDSFRPRSNKVIIEFDGSLRGVGARVILPGVNGLETVISACAATFQTFDLGEDSSYQNGVELLAFAAGLALAVKSGFARHEIHLRGDSMTVLNWVSSGRDGAASTLAYPAMMIVVALAEHWDLAFDTAFTHLSSEANEVCDRLSRGLAVPLEVTGGSPPVKPSGPGSTLWDLIALGQPGSGLGDVQDIIRRWQMSAFRDMQQWLF
jgi:ribonuclease HI